jgi:hypothetical protein
MQLGWTVRCGPITPEEKTMGRMNLCVLAASAGLLALLSGCAPGPIELRCPDPEILVGQGARLVVAQPSNSVETGFLYDRLSLAQSSLDGGSVTFIPGEFPILNFDEGDLFLDFVVVGATPGTVLIVVTAERTRGFLPARSVQMCTVTVVAAAGGGNGNGDGGAGDGNGNANGSPGENGNDNDNGTGGTVLFSDALFDPADWSVMNADLSDTLQANFPQGDPPEPQVTQPEEGGSTLDPAATDELFRQTVTPVYSGDVVVRHLHQSATVDPADGEIELIEAQMDVVLFDALADGRRFSAAPVIVQGNRVWSLAGSIVALDRPGEWQTLSVGTFRGCGSCGIDLRSGGPITFGFQSLTDGISAVRYGVDNWKITVHHK